MEEEREKTEKEKEDEFERELSEVKGEALDELHRLAETYLQNTLQVAISNDQRASTLTSVFGTGAAAFLAAAATLAASEHGSVDFESAAAVTAIGLLIAATYCARACAPVSFFLAGYEPRNLVPAATDRAALLVQSLKDMQIRIDANKAWLETSGKLLRTGTRWALAALPAGFADYLLANVTL